MGKRGEKNKRRRKGGEGRRKRGRRDREVGMSEKAILFNQDGGKWLVRTHRRRSSAFWIQVQWQQCTYSSLSLPSPFSLLSPSSCINPLNQIGGMNLDVNDGTTGTSTVIFSPHPSFILFFSPSLPPPFLFLSFFSFHLFY